MTYLDHWEILCKFILCSFILVDILVFFLRISNFIQICTYTKHVKCRFVPQKFEEIFIKHAKTRRDGLTHSEVEEMILANRDPLDPESW